MTSTKVSQTRIYDGMTHFELFSAQGSNPLAGRISAGSIKRVFDPLSRGYVVDLEFSNVRKVRGMELVLIILDISRAVCEVA